MRNWRPGYFALLPSTDKDMFFLTEVCRAWLRSPRALSFDTMLVECKAIRLNLVPRLRIRGATHLRQHMLSWPNDKFSAGTAVFVTLPFSKGSGHTVVTCVSLFGRAPHQLMKVLSSAACQIHNLSKVNRGKWNRNF